MRQITISIHPPNANVNVSGELEVFWCSGILCRHTFPCIALYIIIAQPPMELHTCTCAGMVVSCMVCVQSYMFM